jgi:hypothetical protein
VVSAPAGAEVRINHKFVGLTPLKNASVPSGDTLTVQVDRRGYGSEVRVLSRAEIAGLKQKGRFTLRFPLTPLPTVEQCTGAERDVWLRYVPRQNLSSLELKTLLDCFYKAGDWVAVVAVADRLLELSASVRALQLRGEAFYRQGKLQEGRGEKEIDAFVFCARDTAAALRGPGWGLCERWVLESRRLECLYLFEETSDLSIEQLRDALDGVTLDAELLRLKEELGNALGNLSDDEKKRCYEPFHQLVEGILKSRAR